VVSVRLAVLIAVLSVPGQWYGPSPTLLNATFTWAGFIGAGIGALVTIAAAYIIATVPWSRRGTGGPLWTITAWVLIGLVSGLSGLAVARTLDPLDFTAAAALSIVARGVIRFALIGLLHQLARGYAARARSDADQSRSQLDDARRMRSALLAEADATERFVAESLHRSVQGRLAAIALLLRLGRRQEALAELDDTCDVTIPLMEGELIALSAERRETVPSVVPAWLGMILIDRVDWDHVEELSPSLAYDLHRVVDECLVNAARHGSATSMEIHITQDVRRLTLHCQDNGSGGAISHRVGLGSQLFTETCDVYGGTWQLLPSVSGTEFTLTAVLARVASR
jgi:signal transduction histidine kinase